MHRFSLFLCPAKNLNKEDKEAENLQMDINELHKRIDKSFFSKEMTRKYHSILE